MNIVLGSFFCLAAITGSLVYSNNYKKKREFYREIGYMNGRLLSAVSFSKQPLKSVMKNFCAGKILAEQIVQYLTAIDENGDISEMRFTGFSEEERSELFDYYKQLGKNDKESQKLFLNDYASLFSERLKAEKEKCDKNCRLFVKLGVLTGLFLFVIVL